MDISAVYEDFTRDELYSKLWQSQGEVVRLKTLLTTAGEELYRLGACNPDLFEAIQDSEREWLPSYCIGGYNQMRSYINELEELVGPRAEDLRQSRGKYLVDWFKKTEPK